MPVRHVQMSDTDRYVQLICACIPAVVQRAIHEEPGENISTDFIIEESLYMAEGLLCRVLESNPDNNWNEKQKEGAK